jgi:transposase
MYHYFQFSRADFLARYHKRSNVETTFSMIKAKFGASVRSKSPIAQTNEVLCKVLCHNLCVLIQSIYELGLTPTFWSNSQDAHKVS